MIPWEYWQYHLEPGDDVIGKLNQVGAKGWEAFHFVNRGNGRVTVLFKRQRPPETPGEAKP